MSISQCKVCGDVCCLFPEAVLAVHDLTIWLSAVHQEAETVFLLDLASVIKSQEGPQKEQEHTRGQQAAAVTAAYVGCSKTPKLRKQPACLASEQVVLERGGLLQPVQLSCPGENSQTNLGPGQFMPSLHRISKAAASDILPHSSRIRYPPIFSPRGICSFEDSDGTTQKIGPDAAQPSILLVVLKGLKARSYNSRTLPGRWQQPWRCFGELRPLPLSRCFSVAACSRTCQDLPSVLNAIHQHSFAALCWSEVAMSNFVVNFGAADGECGAEEAGWPARASNSGVGSPK